MATSIAHSEPVKHPNQVSATSRGAGATSQVDRIGSNRCLKMGMQTNRETVIRLLREVMSKTDTSQKALAINAERPESDISSALSLGGQRNFALEWLCDQDNQFIATFCDELLLARGITVESRRQLLAARIGELTAALVELAS